MVSKILSDNKQRRYNIFPFIEDGWCTSLCLCLGEGNICFISTLFSVQVSVFVLLRYTEGKGVSGNCLSYCSIGWMLSTSKYYYEDCSAHEVLLIRHLFSTQVLL